MAAATRELLWGLRAVSREIDGWRARARSIPDAPTRKDALDSIARKRGHADGAALFWILPRRRHLRLLELLVAYQTAWDFLDNVSERGACAGEANGRQLHLALGEALDPQAPISDYYSHHPCKDDGGYLGALARTCREVCAKLPSYERVRRLVLAEAGRCAVQSLNHHPDPAGRDVALREWARREFPDRPWGGRSEGGWLLGGGCEGGWLSGGGCEGGWSSGGGCEDGWLSGGGCEGGWLLGGGCKDGWSSGCGCEGGWLLDGGCKDGWLSGGSYKNGCLQAPQFDGSWFEVAAAASASLVPHVLLALAAEPACEPHDVAEAYAAYLPWVSLATAMLDSYADLAEDTASGDHSYIAHYGDSDVAVRRVGEIVTRAAAEVRGLRGGQRHAVLVACVVTMYLSKDSARTVSSRARTGRLLRAGGSLTRLLAPVLRIWRVAYAQRSV